MSSCSRHNGCHSNDCQSDGCHDNDDDDCQAEDCHDNNCRDESSEFGTKTDGWNNEITWKVRIQSERNKLS